MHHYEDLIRIFNDCFAVEYNTLLIKGDEEPIYLPSTHYSPHNAIYFAHGFFSSALHECSHWLIAGAERRRLEDFGYWYAPDGRSSEEQNIFQQVEVKPQALEWILSVATGYRFRISIDNLNSMPSDSTPFKDAIHQQVLFYCTQGLTGRAQKFRNALCAFYGTTSTLSHQDFKLESLC